MKLLRLEFYKCRGRGACWIGLGFLVAQMAWMLFSLRGAGPEKLAQGWMMLIYDLALVDAIMLPAAVAALASRSCELEHKGAALKLMETLTPPGRLYDAKLAWGAVQLALLLACRALLFALLGLAKGFGGALPLGRLAGLTALSFGVGAAIYALQQGLSLLYKNQAVPLVVGIFGSFVGLLSLFLPPWVQRLTPWSYFGVLALAGMDWDPASRATSFYWVEPGGLDFGLLALWLTAFLMVGRCLFVRKEV